MSRGFSTIKKVLELMVNSKSFDSCMKNMTLVSAGDGKCVVEFSVDESQLNSGGTLHGGFTATVVDCISTCALMTTGTGAPGVSVDMNVAYLRAAYPGEVLIVDAKTCKAGRTLAFLEVELKKKDGGDLIARGQHTKFIK